MLPRAGVHSDRALASRLGESEALRASASLPCLAPFFGHILLTCITASSPPLQSTAQHYPLPPHVNHQLSAYMKLYAAIHFSDETHCSGLFLSH